MLEKDTYVLHIKMTVSQAKKLGIYVCKCGHPESKHFDHATQPCANCGCKHFRPKIVLPSEE